MANKMIIMGNVGRDPEIKEYTWGKVATFSVAHSERWSSNGEQREKTIWVPVKVTNKHIAGVVERFVKKGTKLYLEGKFVNEKYQVGGEDRYWTGMEIANFDGKLEFAGSKTSGGSNDDYGQSQSSGYGQGSSGMPDLDEEIPF